MLNLKKMKSLIMEEISLLYLYLVAGYGYGKATKWWNDDIKRLLFGLIIIIIILIKRQIKQGKAVPFQ